MKNNINNKGQTTLILILLTAAALIFYASTLNWGHVAQTKSLITIAADQAATMMASDIASYGEMQKQQYLNNLNRKTRLDWAIIIAMIVVVVVIILTICTWGAAAALWGVVIAAIIAVMAIVMAIVSLVLQLCVVQPMMERMWNQLQENQPAPQQFWEQGIGTALMGSVTDQVQITDYFDLNANGVFGMSSSGLPRDTISRFGFYYTDRLKMLNEGIAPQLKFFYDQLGELMNGESCYQNLEDHANNAYSITILNPSCMDFSNGGTDYCGTDPTNLIADPACQMKIPNTITCLQNVSEANSANPLYSSVTLNPICYACSISQTDPSCQLKVSNDYSFQLNDACSDSVFGSNAYNPSCDPCCQPMVVGGKSVRPTSCYNGYPTQCFANPSALKPDGVTPLCPCTNNPNDPSCALPAGECTTNNPYGASYPNIYDPSYQEYSNGISFLDNYGRDQQLVTGALPLTSLPLPPGQPQGNPSNGIVFPNGVFPFFWLMKDYSPEVDNINPGTIDLSSPSSLGLIHWCVANTTVDKHNALFPSVPAPTGFLDLTQLGQSVFTLPYTCQGQDCCVNSLMDSLVINASGASTAVHITVGNEISVNVTITNPETFTIGGDAIKIQGSATEASPRTIAGITFTLVYPDGTTQSVIDTGKFQQTVVTSNPNLYEIDFNNYQGTECTNVLGCPPGTAITRNGMVVSGCDQSTPTPTLTVSGVYTLQVVATDDKGTIGTGTAQITISNPNDCTAVSPAIACGQDSCGGACTACTAPQTCSTSTSKTTGTCFCTPSPACNSSNCGQDSCNTSCGNNKGSCPQVNGVQTLVTCNNGNSPTGPPGTCVCNSNCAAAAAGSCGLDNCGTTCNHCLAATPTCTPSGPGLGTCS